jgi:hypothetical protein
MALMTIAATPATCQSISPGLDECPPGTSCEVDDGVAESNVVGEASIAGLVDVILVLVVDIDVELIC